VAVATLLKRHFESARDRAGNGICIVGIDQQCALAFRRGSGKARKNKDAGVIHILCGNIFFGDKIHAVAKRRHQGCAR
jgi:hypothetical protein